MVGSQDTEHEGNIVHAAMALAASTSGGDNSSPRTLIIVAVVLIVGGVLYLLRPRSPFRPVADDEDAGDSDEPSRLGLAVRRVAGGVALVAGVVVLVVALTK